MRSVLFAAVLTSSTMMVGIHWTPGTRYTIATVGGDCLGWKRETCYEADLASSPTPSKTVRYAPVTCEN